MCQPDPHGVCITQRLHLQSIARRRFGVQNLNMYDVASTCLFGRFASLTTARIQIRTVLELVVAGHT